MPQNAQENLQTLLEASLLLSSKRDLGDLLKAILSMASKVVRAETASLLLLDNATQELYFHVALGLGPEASRKRLKIGEGVAGKVAETRKSVIINDVRADPNWTATIDRRSGFGTRSILAAPMMIKGRLIGVLEAINHIGGLYTDGDLRIFEAFASQAAIAIDNAQLFASLNEEKTKLDAAFSQMGEGAILADEHGAILLANAAASRLLGLGRIVATSLPQALSTGKMTPPLDKLLAASASMLQPFEIIREKPKKLVLAGTASSFQFEDVASQRKSTVRFLLFRDVTDERQEELLKRSFLSLISHKLRTPLSPILGFSEALVAEPGLPPAVSKSLATIATQAHKLNDLVEKLLAFTVIEGLEPAQIQPKPFALDAAIREALASLQGWLQDQKAEVTVEAPAETTAFGDSSLVRQALKHLIENGVKFNSNARKKLLIAVGAENGHVTVKVQDNGPGIPPEDLDKVFGKFHQVEASFTGQVGGAGLGLPFVKKVIEVQGGRVWLESKLSEGTTAVFTLPKAPSGR